MQDREEGEEGEGEGEECREAGCRNAAETRREGEEGRGKGG